MADRINNVVFTSKTSVADTIEQLIQEARVSIDAALYRINNPRLARALAEAGSRDLQVRILLDRGKYEETQVTRELLTQSPAPFRLVYGRRGKGSKLHHKFVILDSRLVLTGSYNWTIESEKENHDHITILRDPALVLAFQQEFNQLWPSAPEAPASEVRQE